jgi:hypothetical protein
MRTFKKCYYFNLFAVYNCGSVKVREPEFVCVCVCVLRLFSLYLRLTRALSTEVKVIKLQTPSWPLIFSLFNEFFLFLICTDRPVTLVIIGLGGRAV